MNLLYEIYKDIIGLIMHKSNWPIVLITSSILLVNYTTVILNIIDLFEPNPELIIWIYCGPI